jgi:hypothetical protein
MQLRRDHESKNARRLRCHIDLAQVPRNDDAHEFRSNLIGMQPSQMQGKAAAQ